MPGKVDKTTEEEMKGSADFLVASPTSCHPAVTLVNNILLIDRGFRGGCSISLTLGAKPVSITFGVTTII